MKIVPAFALLLACGIGVAEEAATHDGLILQPTLYHGEEFPEAAASGQTWLALLSSTNGYALVETEITVEDAHDAILDAEGEMSGKDVSVELVLEVVMLFRNVEGLEPGTIDAVQESPAITGPLFPGESHFLWASDNVAPLTYFAYGNVASKTDQGWHRLYIEKYALGFTTDNNGNDPFVREILSTEDISSEGMPSLRFAGDLNRDGHLDLLVDQSTHYNVRHPTLFLSSVDADGVPSWKIVAELHTTGC